MNKTQNSSWEKKTTNKQTKKPQTVTQPKRKPQKNLLMGAEPAQC